MNKSIGRCGDANPNGNVSLMYKGNCGQDLLLAEAYRCTGCNGWFHKECIFKHFELEKEHDWGRKKEREQIFRWLLNYWNELKQQGNTDKQFIINFDKCLKSLN